LLEDEQRAQLLITPSQSVPLGQLNLNVVEDRNPDQRIELELRLALHHADTISEDRTVQ
jgi:hypothetical protein